MIITKNNPNYNKICQIIQANIHHDKELLDGHLLINEKVHYAFIQISIFSETKSISFFEKITEFVRLKNQKNIFIATLDSSNEITCDYPFFEVKVKEGKSTIQAGEHQNPPFLEFNTNDDKEISVNEIHSVLFKSLYEGIGAFFIFNETQNWFFYQNNMCSYSEFVFTEINDWIMIQEVFKNQIMTEEDVKCNLALCFNEKDINYFNESIKPRAFFKD